MTIISVKSSTTILPSEKTPCHTLWLSSLDWMVVPVLRHTSSVFTYHSSPTFFNANILKTSLSEALVPFYPLAGRLQHNEKGGVEINCNAEGVLFVEAETEETLDEFGKITPEFEPKKWLIPHCDYAKGISSFPLLMVQLTRFGCGGVALGLAQHHQLADGTSYLHFINSWSRLAKGLPLDLLPLHNRLPYLSPRCPPQINFSHFDSEYGPHQGLLGDKPHLEVLNEATPSTVSVFNLTKDQVTTLKAKATLTLPDDVKSIYKLTTYEVLAAHVWRCACKARDLASDQEVRLFIPTNGCSRLKNPPLPQGFFGNVTFYPACISKTAEITSNTLGYVASKVHETMTRVNDEEYLRSTIDYLESHPDKESLIRGQHKLMCPNVNVNSWTKLPLMEADFGWGKPVYVGSGGIGYEGQSFITSNFNEDGGLAVSIKLFTIHMLAFSKCFYDF